MRWRALLLAVLATPATAAPVTLPARGVSYQPEVRAWAQVESIAPLVMRTAVAARIARVLVVPGQVVKAGEPLVTLAGPQLQGELSAARARGQAALHELAAAQRTLAAAKRTYPVVTDRKTLDDAQAGLAAAESESAAAHAALATLQAQQTLSSPTPAVVGEVGAASGADLPAGTPLVTLIPRGSLWLRAEVFGDLPLPAATTVRFLPADGEPAMVVRQVAELPARAPDGARVFNFTAAGAAHWQAGETGDLIWYGSPQIAVAVPSEALILDAGRWYVLAEVHGKLVAQAVTPGPTRGTNVVITQGLSAGVPVVVRQAYLLFHRDFSARYAPSD
ncbi:MAG: biotin/lipoyl-binding protein [Rhodanobacteraceae bacterium]|nr:MAG: biotin/lipoyl-binding protein [Rhodanobacteraceae bacterium]